MQLNLAVVGGGIVGSLVAFELKKSNIEFTWFSGNLEESSSVKAGGMIAPFSELDTGEAWLSLVSEKAISSWKRLHKHHPEAIF